MSLLLKEMVGYDIRSFETDGQQRFIEVKTTSFGELRISVIVDARFSLIVDGETASSS